VVFSSLYGVGPPLGQMRHLETRLADDLKDRRKTYLVLGGEEVLVGWLGG
jgi:hypothetical protein